MNCIPLRNILKSANILKRGSRIIQSYLKKISCNLQLTSVCFHFVAGVIRNFHKKFLSMKRNEILLLFDVDNTLTKPRSVIDDEFESFLYGSIKPLATVGIVSGANIEKLYEQLKGEKILELFDYIFPENGIVHIENGTEVQKSSFNEKLGEETLKRFINFVLRYIADLDLPFKRGTFIEYRNGMMNICPVGRQCTVEEREAFSQFDQKQQVRKTMIAALEKEFSDVDLVYAIGGMISFDAYPRGWDKSFCLSRIPPGKFKEIHFFGDQTKPGGNDFEIYSDERTIGHHVNNFEDTRKVLSKIFKL